MKGRKQTKKEGGQSGTYPRETRASLRNIEMKRNENEYFSQITVAFLISRIEHTESKLLVPLGRGWNVGD